MIWILSTDIEIVVDEEQIMARSKFIRLVTGAEVSSWELLHAGENMRFFVCRSTDKVDGVFITAHNSTVFDLCGLPQIYDHKMVIANTCIWTRGSHKKVLERLRLKNPDVDLYYSKQEISIDSEKNLRRSATIINIGEFGFQTSLSERELFINRYKGLEEALRASFDRVSPLFLIGE